MKVVFNGHYFTFNLRRENLRKMVASHFPDTSEEQIPNSLVMYNPATNTITVDEHADEAYVMYAAIHECICCGTYKHLAPEVADRNKRCGSIDTMIVQNMPKSERKAYIAKRIEMFETLVEKGLNPQMEPMFRESIRMLRSL